NRAWRGALVVLVAALLSGQLIARQEDTKAPYQYPVELLSELIRLHNSALTGDYAYLQLAHLCNNIGPRLSGSAQAQQAVQYVAAELRQLGLDVQLEKVMVPHWVRGAETGELVQFASQAPGTTQKIVLTALGGSVATPSQGVTAEILVVDSFAQLTSLGREKVAGKIVLFNVRFDKQLAAQGLGL